MNTEIIIQPHQLRHFVNSLLHASGVDTQEAKIIADVLIWTDLIGRPLQGVNRLPAYLKRLELGLIQSPCQPEFIQKSETMQVLNGGDGFGHYLGHIAMHKAIELADEFGIGLVGVNHSNHFGAGAYYVYLAAEQQKLGLAVSNSVSKVAPYGGVTPVFGTNPFAFSAPIGDEYPILVDFSTGASAGSKIIKAAERGETIPAGLFIDAQGQPITDASQTGQGAMLPFGGAKGFCLGLMIEILSGVITGAAISHQVASLHQNFERPSNVGHFFMALDISKLMSMEHYFERIETLIGFIKQAKPQPGFDEILLPGETRWRLYQRYQKDGIPFDENDLEQLIQLAQKVSVPLPW